MTTDHAVAETTGPVDAPSRTGRRWGSLALIVLLVVAGLWITGAIPCQVLRGQPACWVSMLPGPTEPVDDLIEVSGTEIFGSDGELLLTTVLVDNSLSMEDYVRGLFDDDIDLLRREQVYPEGRTVEDAKFENEILMSDSQLGAKVAALTELGVDLEMLPSGAEVVTVVDDSPAAEVDLAAGDVVVSVDEVEVGDVDEAVAELGRHEPGDEVALTVQRDGEDVDVVVSLGDNPDDPGQPYVGVLLRNFQVLPVDIAIDAGAIGGPSAGLVFALGIIDRTTAVDLTGGRNIAVTGTIQSDGTVGPIGGIVQKIAGAASSDVPADVFLVPDGNWEAALTASPSQPITIVRVADVDDAVSALEALAAGEEPAEAIELG